VITTGWALAVAVGVYAIGGLTGAHLNPAVTLGLAAIGSTEWDVVPYYLVGEFLGAFIGAVVVYLHYLPHWAATEDPGLKLAVFSTGPAIRNTVTNLISEIIGTFMLVFGVLLITSNELAPGFAALLVGFLVWGIGLSLGGPTGYAINPARDLGPRIAHAVLPIAGKGGSDWEYSWIPVVGPIIGGVLGAVAFQALFTNYLMV
jgi:glycerol uptake facilitator protein